MAKRQLGLEEIASEVGRLFGTTEAHAKKWLKQREDLVNALQTIGQKTNRLLAELGGVPSPFKRRGRPAGVPVIQPGMRESRKKRVMSAQTRAKMRAAAKKRWAEIRKSGTKTAT